MASTKKKIKTTSDTYPLVSLLFINHNGEKYLKKCFNSLFTGEYPENKLEVILVDNASTDNSILLVQRHFPQVKIIKVPNQGYGAGANYGFAQSRGEIIGVMNVDLIFTRNWLHPLISLFKKTPALGVAAPVLVPFGSTFSPRTMQIPCFSRLGFPYTHTVKYQKAPRKTMWINGAAMLIRRRVYKLAEGFDPLFFLYFEDYDFCYRSWITGYSVMLVPESIIQHKESGLINSIVTTPEKVLMSTQNNTLVILKNYSLLSLLKYLPLYIIVKSGDIISDIIHFKHFSWAKAKAKGLLLAFKLLPQVYFKRKTIQSKRMIKDQEIFKYNFPSPFLKISKIKILNKREEA